MSSWFLPLFRHRLNKNMYLWTSLILDLLGIALSPGTIWQDMNVSWGSGDLTYFIFPFLTHHCATKDLLGSQEDFLWWDRGVIHYNTASIISYKSLFPVLKKSVPSWLFHKFFTNPISKGAIGMAIKTCTSKCPVSLTDCTCRKFRSREHIPACGSPILYKNTSCGACLKAGQL